MAPAIFRDGPFRLFFFSREERREHVRVTHRDEEVKFWLTPEIMLATRVDLSDQQVRTAEVIVRRHMQEVLDAWHRHFGS